MSDQSGAISDLEELFLAREFGRPSGRHLRAVEEDLGEAPEPRELEEVFCSRDFGRPVALELLEGGNEPVPNVVEFPFAGPGAKPLDRAVRQRAVAALSGVAAAALVIAGLASAGGHAGRADVSALAHQSSPNGGTSVGANPGGAVPAPGPTSNGAPVTGVTTAGLAGTTSSGGAPSVVFASQPAATPAATISGVSGPGSGGTPPPTPAPGGGVTGVAPVDSVVGTTVSAAGSSVSAASGTVASAVPSAPAVAGTMSQTGNSVSVLGQTLATSPAG
jgi:hypothetical protein